MVVRLILIPADRVRDHSVRHRGGAGRELFFAGEHTMMPAVQRGYFNAAVETGQRAAKEVHELDETKAVIAGNRARRP